MTEDTNDALYVFIRHNFNQEERRGEEWLLSNKKVGIMFDGHGFDPKSYKAHGAEGAVKLFNECSQKGAFVCATYETDKTLGLSSRFFFGYIRKGAKPYERTEDVSINRSMKYLPLNIIATALTSDLQMLLVAQPRGGTIYRWNKVKKILKAIETRTPLEREVGSLSTAQQEILCQEYLRWRKRLSCLLLPVGRTLPIVDISGLDPNGKEVVAQVTYSESSVEVKKKLDKLKNEYALSGAHLYFFCRESIMPKDPKVKFFSMKRVFEQLDRKPIYRRMIDQMILDPKKTVSYL